MKILKLITVVILFCFNYSIIYAQIPINTFDISKTKPPKAVPANGMKIFYIVKAGENEFWQIVLDGAKKAAKHFGAKLIHQEPTSEFEISKQVSILETSFSTNPSAIVIAPA
jgi:ribose transport system substrate-binding protein